jgi:hypothetical protein
LTVTRFTTPKTLILKILDPLRGMTQGQKPRAG